MAILAALYLLFSAARAAIEPVAFARALGLPLTSPADNGFVFVYATRSALIGLVALTLAGRRDLSPLALLVAVAAGLPVLDAALIAGHRGPTASVAVQLATFGYLVVTWYLLRRHIRRSREVASAVV